MITDTIKSLFSSLLNYVRQANIILRDLTGEQRKAKVLEYVAAQIDVAPLPWYLVPVRPLIKSLLLIVASHAIDAIVDALNRGWQEINTTKALSKDEA